MVKLKGNKIGDEGIKALCAALDGSVINTIDVSYNNITWEGVTYLNDLADCNPKLKNVNLKKNNINKLTLQRAARQVASTEPVKPILTSTFKELLRTWQKPASEAPGSAL